MYIKQKLGTFFQSVCVFSASFLNTCINLLSVCSNVDSKMVCFDSSVLKSATDILKALVKIIVFKVVLGIFDVGSDIVNGYNFLSGQFMLGLYSASQTREEYDLLTNPVTWGYQTICLPWFPGFLRIIFCACDTKWKNVKCAEVFKIIGGYFLMFLAWPLFSPLM